MVNIKYNINKSIHFFLKIDDIEINSTVIMLDKKSPYNL